MPASPESNTRPLLELAVKDDARFVARARDAAVLQTFLVPRLLGPALNGSFRQLEKLVRQCLLAEPHVCGLYGVLVGIGRSVELRQEIPVDFSARGQDAEWTDARPGERIKHLAIGIDGEIENLGDDVIFAFDLFQQPFLRPALIEKQVAGFFGEQPGDVQPRLLTLTSLRTVRRPDAWSASECVSTTCSKHRVRPEVLFEMRDDRIAGFLVPPSISMS